MFFARIMCAQLAYVHVVGVLAGIEPVCNHLKYGHDFCVRLSLLTALLTLFTLSEDAQCSAKRSIATESKLSLEYSVDVVSSFLAQIC
jgi:hypothetical protein